MHQEDAIKNIRRGERVALASLVIIVVLAGLKAAAGYLTNTVVLYADAVGSVSDAVTMFAIFFGLFLTKREADTQFQYGYAKIETFVAFVVSVLVFGLGIDVLLNSVDRLFVLESIHLPLVALGMVVVSTVVSFGLSAWLIRTGKSINALSLVASGREKRMDMWAEGVVLVGIGAQHFAIPYAEGIAGIVLSLLIFKTAAATIREAVLYLLDYWGDPKVVRQITDLIHEHSNIVTSVKRIRLRRSGPYIFGEAFLEINPFVDIRDFRNDLYLLEEKIEQSVEHLKDFVLYVSPTPPQAIRIAVPITTEAGLDSSVADHTEETDHYLLVDIRGRTMADSRVVTFSGNHAKEPEKAYPALATFFRKHDVNIVVASHVHSLLFYHLRLHNIQVYPLFSNVEKAGAAIQLLLIDV